MAIALYKKINFTQKEVEYLRPRVQNSIHVEEQYFLYPNNISTAENELRQKSYLRKLIGNLKLASLFEEGRRKFYSEKKKY